MKMSFQTLARHILLAGLLVAAQSQLSTATAQTRNIRVCVLNDSVEPVQKSLIEGLLSHASHEFGAQVSIRFNVEESHSFSLDLFLNQEEQFRRVRRTCRRSEIAVIFSDQMIRSEDWYSNGGDNSKQTEKSPYLLGLSNSRGYAIIASVPYGLSSSDSVGNPMIYGTIKHELGHLFFEGHLDDPRSFLYPYANAGNGWTDETRWVIRQHCLREWQLEPSVLHLTREDLLRRNN